MISGWLIVSFCTGFVALSMAEIVSLSEAPSLTEG